MNDRHCPCGARLDRSSSVRPLKSPCLRMLMSMRTMKSLTSQTMVCNVCRHSYDKWKKENNEFSTILTFLETNMVEVNEDSLNSVNMFCYPCLYFFVFSLLVRMMQWMFKGMMPLLQ